MTHSRFIVMAVCLGLLAKNSYGQVDPGKVLGQTPASGSLPAWSQPDETARQKLGKSARDLEKGVLMAGSADTTHGTSWVISRKNRLLVTNAHVADLYHLGKGEMFAIPNGTAQVYKVEKVYYHPGVRRILPGGTGSVRSMDPKDGEIDPTSPDLAILKLTSDGPDLPVEFPLATPEEIASIFAQPVAIFGFPGHDTQGWPKLGKKVAGTYHDGVVSRVTDFEMSTDSPYSEQQFLQYTMTTWGGFSGSPVFLPNGHVAAVHNMGRTVKSQNGVVKSIAHGIRCDSILELLVHHRLDTEVPFPIDRSKVAVARWNKPDARSVAAREKLAKASKLVDEAWYCFFERQEYEKGYKLCNEAIQIAPQYARAYFIRSHGKNSYAFVKSKELSDKQKRALVNEILEDAKMASKLEPGNYEYLGGVCSALNFLGGLTDDKTMIENNLAVLDKLLTVPDIGPHVRSDLYSSRAISHSCLNNLEASLRDFDEAVRWNPGSAGLYETRAKYFRIDRQRDHGVSDQKKAEELRKLPRNLGLEILDITPGGPASAAELKKGDIILFISDLRVKATDDFISVISIVKGPVDLLVIRANSKKRERIRVTPIDGKIGVTIQQVEFK